MKKKLSIFFFVVSTLFFIALMALWVDFAISTNGFTAQTDGGVLGGLILISVYFGASLIISALGLGFSIPCVVLSSKKVIKICSCVEITIFSAGAIFSVAELLLHF